MEKIHHFFSLLETPNTFTQVGELNAVVPLKASQVQSFVTKNKAKDLYFLAGISNKLENKSHRASDDDILEKKYVAFDFDIRKDLGDCDDETLEEAMRIILDAFKSSSTLKDYAAAICSGNGLHVYYFSEHPVSLMGKKATYSLGYDWLCTTIEAVIRTHYVFNMIDLPVICPDRACRNVGRIMRVPESWNHKNGKNNPVRFLEYTGKFSTVLNDLVNDGETVKEESVEYVEEASKIFNKPKLTTNLDSLAGLTKWEQLRKIDNKYMLERLSGSWLVNHEKYTFSPRGGNGGWLIYLKGKDTPINAWIDADGYIGSPGIQGRTWVEWVMNWPDFKRSARELLQWVDQCLQLPTATKGRVTNITLTTPEELVQGASSFFSSYRGRFHWFTDAIDNEMPVFMPGDYTLVVGESGVGKTTMAVQFAMENARRGRKVIYFSLEQNPKQLLENYIAKIVGVTEDMQKHDLVNFDHNQQAFEIIKLMPKSFKFPQLANSSSQLSAEDIIQAVKMHSDVELIVIDNLGFLRQPDQDEEWKELKELNRALVQLAHDERRPVGIFALHHFKKGIGTQKGPKDNDLIRGSRKLIDDADLVVQVTRCGFPDGEIPTDRQIQENENKRNLYVTKDRRHGKIRSVEYYLKDGKITNDNFTKTETIPF